MPLNAASEAPGLDGGRAWLMAGAGFVACFVAFGVAYSFGAFFKPIAHEFGASRAQTSALFAITGALYSLLGLGTGYLSDRYGPRRVVMAGAVAMAAGLLGAASVHRLWLSCASYGLGVGIGVACAYVPMVALVGGWFSRNRNIALGIAVSGIGAGTLVCSPASAKLIDRYGWREAYVILSVASLVLLSGCAMVSRPPPLGAAAPRGHLGNLSRSPDFIRLYLACLLSSVTIYIPFVYLPDFAQSLGLREVVAAGLVGIIGAASVAGRLSFGMIADRTGILTLFKGSMLVLALSYIVWPVARGYPMLLLFALVMGSAYGGLVSLTPAVVAELFGIEGLGAMLGALYTSSAISALAGPPLAGFVIDEGGSYSWAAALAAGAGLAAFAFLLQLKSVQPAIFVESLHAN